MCRSLNSETPVRAELNQFLLLSLFFFLDRVAFFVPSRRQPDSHRRSHFKIDRSNFCRRFCWMASKYLCAKPTREAFYVNMNANDYEGKVD